MKIEKSRRRLLAIMVSALAAVGLVTPALAYDVYHGVQADAGTGAVLWTNASFGVSAGPPVVPPAIPNLSFFYFANDVAAQNGFPVAPQCIVKVNLPNTAPAPVVNAQDTVGNAAVAIANPVAMPFPWAIVFDNNPPGHWNITKGAMVDLNLNPVPSNGTAGTVAALGFQNLANAPGNGVTVINGTLGNCHA